MHSGYAKALKKKARTPFGMRVPLSQPPGDGLHMPVIRAAAAAENTDVPHLPQAEHRLREGLRGRSVQVRRHVQLRVGQG